jgi:hypothetical protein
MSYVNYLTPYVINRFIETTNNADTEGFIKTFATDATVNDYGHCFSGLDGIRSWNGSDNIGVQSHFDLLSVQPGSAPESWIASVRVTGSSYNGAGEILFQLRGNLIASIKTV